MQVLIEKAKSGAETLVLSLNNRRYSVYSGHDPERDGERYFRSYADKPGGLCIFIGLGLAYHILPFERALKKTFEKTGERSDWMGRIVVLEPDESIYDSVRGCDCVQKLLQSRRVHLYAGDAVQIFIRDIKTRYDYLFYRRIQVLSYPVLKNIFRRQYEGLEKSIKKGLDELTGDGLTIARFARIWINNYCRNSGVKSIKPASSLYGCFSGNALITGAGPSLDRVLAKILRYRERLFLIAVDASVKPLLKYRIRPDMIVTVDPQAAVFYHFSGLGEEDISGIPAVMSPMTYPPVFGLFTKKYIYHTKHPLCMPREGENKYVINHRAVSSIAFELACRMGFTSIHLAGFDFSYPGYRAYARHTFFYEYAAASGTRFYTAGTAEGQLIRCNNVGNLCLKAYRGISASEERGSTDTGPGERVIFSTLSLDSYRLELEAIIDEMKQNIGVEVFNWDSLGNEIRGTVAEKELNVSDVRWIKGKPGSLDYPRRIQGKADSSDRQRQSHEVIGSGYIRSEDERIEQLRITLALRYRLFKHATGFDEAVKYADTYLCKRFGW